MALLFVVMACATGAVCAGDAATSPKALRAVILEAELAQHSVHYVTATSYVGGMGGVRARDVADVARDRGIQRWTVFSLLSGRTGHLTILVVHSTAYVRGDAFGLEWAGFGAVASRYAGKWFSVPRVEIVGGRGRNSPIYVLVARNVTIGSFARGCVPRSHLSLATGTVGGRTMRGLRGTAPDGGVLTTYVHESGTPLPVEGIEVEYGAQVGLGHVTLSAWNEPVRVQAPTHSVPITHGRTPRHALAGHDANSARQSMSSGGPSRDDRVSEHDNPRGFQE
jgi:hypothetical protein